MSIEARKETQPAREKLLLPQDEAARLELESQSGLAIVQFRPLGVALLPCRENASPSSKGAAVA